MKVNLIIPFKNSYEIKSRLSSLFSYEERLKLSFIMLKDILQAAFKSNVISKIFIVSLFEFNIDNSDVEIIINKKDLNNALYDTINISRKLNYDLQIIIPSDIPLIEPEDFQTVVNLMKNFDVVISPSCDGGTNLLALRKDVNMNLKYGEEKKSFIEHLNEAIVRDYKVKIYTNERISLDVDDIPRFLYVGLINNNNKETVLYIKKKYEKN